MKRPFPYVHSITDRHGTRRHYFRRRGFETVTLRGPWGSADFLDDYRRALAGDTVHKLEIGTSRNAPGSVAQATALYFRSVAFGNLAPSTKRARRRILERFREDHGDWNLSRLERKHVEGMVAKKMVATPAAAKIFLKSLRAVISEAIASRLLKDDPTIGIRVKLPVTDGFRTWTEQEIEKFESFHPHGSPARLAFALLIFTAQRRSDVIKLGRQHIQGGYLHFRQQKTKTVLDIPVLPGLQEILAVHAERAEHLTFLTTRAGEPFTAAGFGNWFRDRCREAGLPLGLSAHGLRKAALTRLADAGCSAHELRAISGHKSLVELEAYTRDANQKKMAASAMEKLKGGTSSGNPAQGFPESRHKSLKEKGEK